LLDPDQKGLICLQDIQRAAQELGEDWTDEDISEMIQEADPSGEGLIEPDALFAIVRRVNL